MKNKIILNRKQKIELENLLLQAKLQPSQEIKKWRETEGLPEYLQCPRCKYSGFFYPTLIHIVKEHNVTNYNKIITSMLYAW